MLYESDKVKEGLWWEKSFLEVALIAYRIYEQTKQEQFKNFGEFFKTRAEEQNRVNQIL